MANGKKFSFLEIKHFSEISPSFKVSIIREPQKIQEWKFLPKKFVHKFIFATNLLQFEKSNWCQIKKLFISKNL